MTKFKILCAVLMTMSLFNKIQIDKDIINYHNYRKNEIIYYASVPDENGEFEVENYVGNINCEKNDFDNTAQILNIKDPSNGDSSDLYVPNSSFLSNYYLHLSKNMPYNKLGICGYTGISMFLSYYDTYWNDQVIEEKYDAISTVNSNIFFSTVNQSYDSPGVYNNITNSSPTMSDLRSEALNNGYTNVESEAYKQELDRLIMREILEQINTQTFLGKLFEIAIANGSIKPHFEMNQYYVANEGYLDGIGVGNEIMTNVLTDYVEQNEVLNKSVTITSSKIKTGIFVNYKNEKERIRNEIIEIIKSGKPVLMGGQGYTDSNSNGKQENGEDSWGHVAIAYEYDANNDIIYGNLGWGSTDTHRNFDEFFNIEMSDYWSFSFNSELKQDYTNNYYFTNKNATYSPYMDATYNTIIPSEYGFPEAYAPIETESSIYLPSSRNKTLISFNRYRCGYIEEEAINLSPRREGYSEAYIEYTLPKNVDKILVDLSFWSAKEFTNDSNSEYKIEYLLDGDWVTLVDLWEDVDLPTDRANPITVEVDFPSNTKSFRFYSWSLYTSDRNKGRLSIFDMMIIYDNN